MSDFFDEISRKAEARRNLSFEKQKTLLNSGILTPSMTNGSLDDSLTDEQIAEKEALIEAKQQQAYNDAIGVPFGVVEGAMGLLGDVELLGQGIKGAYNAEKGKKWDGFVEGLSDRDTMFWTTQDNMERTDKWLEGTELGDRLKGGSGGRLLGEILAPIPVPKGAIQAGKIAGKAGMAVATHPLTRYVADTARTEAFNAINNVNPNSPIGRGISMFTPPKQNMVIGPNSTKFDMPSYNEFKKQIDVDKVMESRRKNNSVLPTKEEERLWDLTAKKGNPTFIDIDGVIKQEIPTGAMNLKAPLKLKPANILENDSLGSYGLDKKLALFKMSKAQERLGYNAYLQGDKIGINVSNAPDYQKPRWANDEVSARSHLADKNTVDTYLAHEGQHGIQHAEDASRWATGSHASALFSKTLDKILKEGKKARKFKNQRIKLKIDSPTPKADRVIARADAAEQMIKNGQMSTDRLKNNTLARRNYFFDRGEIGARATQDRVNLSKNSIAQKHYLKSVDNDLAQFDKNGNILAPDGTPITYNDLPNQALLEQYKSGVVRDRSVIDQLNQDELGKMLDDEIINASAQDYKSFVNDYMKKLMKKKGLRLGQEYPNLKKEGFEYLGTEGKMGHGFQMHFRVGGKEYHVGSGASTPRTDIRALDRTLTGLNKYFDKGSDTYMNAEKSHIIVKGDGTGGRTSFSVDPDKYFGELEDDIIPKTRQNEITKLVKTAKGTEIEKPLGYTGDPMLDTNWDTFLFSSQKPGMARKEVITPMNNVLDANGNIIKQPSTGLNSEAISNMNPMEVARGQGAKGYAELKEELRTLYKEATGDPALQKQIRDKIVEVDRQMNMFDPDVAKPKKSIYEEVTGFNDEGDEVRRYANPEDPYSADKSALSNIARDIKTAEADDSFFTGKGALPENPNTISDISINAGGTPVAPVMTKAADKKIVKSIENSLNNMRRSPDETINEILRHISDLEAKPVPKQARLAQADKVAKDKMLKYAYEAIESIQRNSYMGADVGNVARVPTNALDNIGVQTAETYVPKVNKPRYDDPTEYEFDEMLRSWDKEPMNIKTRDRYVPNGKRLDRSKLKDFEDPAQGALPDYGRGRIKKKDEFFDELEEPRISASMSPEVSVDDFIDQHKLYHGGDPSFAKKLQGKKFNALAKNKDSGSGGNRYGLSTTTKQETASDFAYGNAGDDGVVSELYIHPEARVLNLDNPNFLDDMSEAELKKISKDYDVIRDVNNTQGESEYRILTDSILRDRDQLESYYSLYGNKTTLNNKDLFDTLEEPRISASMSPKIDKVDDWIKADKEAQKEAVKRLGLPENNTAADRAKAMGFGDETYYHGSANNIEEFKPNTFFADNGESASSYALDRGWDGGANVTPIRTRVSNPASPDDVKDAAVQTGAADGYDLDVVESWEFTTPKTIGAFNPDDPSVQVIDALKGTGIPGYDSAKHWDWDLNQREIDSLQIFEPSDIRSPLAHFNPKYLGVGAGSILSADLMAGEITLEEYKKILKKLQDKGLLND